MTYDELIAKKSSLCPNGGFTPTYIPGFLFDFQAYAVNWALEKGRCALFENCGLGKTVQELVWADNVARHTNKPVLILAPLAVSFQTVDEARKFGIECGRSSGGSYSNLINVTNYDNLHKFSPDDLGGLVCDESSILKHFSGATQKLVTRFALKVPYRLLASATPAPNSYDELGTSSEALGYLGYSDMLTRFFKQTDKSCYRMDEVKATSIIGFDRHKDCGNAFFAKVAYRAVQQMDQWRLKGHAEIPFWKWVGSWAKAFRKPSEIGFADTAFVLPPLVEVFHVVKARAAMPGNLFTLPAVGFHEERKERRWTINERCEKVAELVSDGAPAIIWCQLNDEADALERVIPDAVQVAGKDSEEEKEARLASFCRGETRVLITKAKIAGFGINMQNCAHVVTFASHSWEQYFQQVRRCWRFGQKSPVRVDVVCSEGEQRVMENMLRKATAAEAMFDNITRYVNEAQTVAKASDDCEVEVPAWIT